MSVILDIFFFDISVSELVVCRGEYVIIFSFKGAIREFRTEHGRFISLLNCYPVGRPIVWPGATVLWKVSVGKLCTSGQFTIII